MIDLTGKCAFVTGGTKGIGLAIARALADNGARVFICARNEREVERAAGELNKEYSGRISGCRCDVRSYEEVREAITRAAGAMGGP